MGSTHVPSWGRLPCPIVACSDLKASEYDGILLVCEKIDSLTDQLSVLKAPLESQRAVDETVEKSGAVVPINLPAGRLIYSPTGPLNRDYDDVRRFSDAADKGIKRALSTGCRKPLLVVVPHSTFPESFLVAVLGALHALYVPLEIREHALKIADTKLFSKVDLLGVLGGEKVIKVAAGLESGRFVCRDIGGSDPERMAPPRVAEYVEETFKNSAVSVHVVAESPDNLVFEKKYPLMAAVNRCARMIDRHQGRIIELEYVGAGPVTNTYMLVGKGVTYDTGGADIKAGGVMAGMHRDKCGAAAVGGFFQTLAQLQPRGVKVVGRMSMVRNSVGADSYVADELIVSRAGKRIRVGNTDAEGRMAMADCLCEMKEMAVNEVNPYLMTVATLTGHACLTVGDGYAICLDNGPARQAKCSQLLQAAGDTVGDPFEISTIRREDYVFHTGKSEYEDVLQCNNLPSSRTARGHQGPAAFLILASGLDKHGVDSDQPLKYSHLDIAAASGPFPGVPTGSPVVALAAALTPGVLQQ